MRDYITEQTKKLHLYVVRTDLAVFRHLHPTMADDGTWSAPVTLPEAGDYRVVAEFVARDEGGDGDFIVLGESKTVPGPWEPRPCPTDSWAATPTTARWRSPPAAPWPSATTDASSSRSATPPVDRSSWAATSGPPPT